MAKEPLNVILIGPPGVGKGTLASIISDNTGISHISTGDLFRNEIAQKTPLGTEAASFINKGDLVPDSLTMKIILNKITKENNKKGFLLDGFPRTHAQAECLAQIIKSGVIDIDLIVHLHASKELLITRISGRLVCESCGRNYHKNNAPPKKAGICDYCGSKVIAREDDAPEAIARRFDVYNRQTQEVIDFYGGSGLMIKISGSLTPRETYDCFVDELKKKNLI